MKKWVLFLFICCLTNNFSQTVVSPQFSELRGMEDKQGNTHLFYRIYTHAENFPIYSYTNNDIFHLDLSTFSDSLFLRDYIESNPAMFNAIQVNAYRFWNKQDDKFIYGGVIGGQDPIPFINRFDQPDNLLNYFCCEVKAIDISAVNDSLIYAGGQLYGEIQSNTIRSSDGGFNWIPITDTLTFLSLNPFNDNFLFLENFTGFLYRSTDGANSFHLVDVLNQPANSTSFLYDTDQLHIYRLFSDRTLRVSSNKGEEFSWETKYSSDSQIFISIDESKSGNIYLADKKNIYISTDYGDNFSLYKTLDRKIVGIYKKPTAGCSLNNLYAATKYKIYEITTDTIQEIKQLPPIDYYDWYPLSVGNLWVYENYYWENGTPTFAGYSWNWIDRTLVLQNGKEYFEIIWRYTNGMKDTSYLRLDSLNAIIYGYAEDSGEDLLYESLFAEVGDSICYDYNPVWACQIVQSEEPFDILGMSTTKRELYPNNSGWVCNHTLVKGIGLFEQGCGDLVGFSSIIIGCVIDDVVYGDTNVVSVENEKNPITTTFKLAQNYPNPFNPTTTLPFVIGHRSFVSLKVYDILGTEIATLVNEEKPAGEYEVKFDASSCIRNLVSGIYFYQLKAGDFIQTKKMVLLH